MHKVLLFILILTSVQCTSGQSNTSGLKLLSTDELKEDFLVFRNALWKTHPALDRYIEKKRVNQLFDSCLLSLSEPRTVTDFYVQIKFLISALQDGHLRSRASDEFNSYITNQALLFPIEVRFLENKAYAICSSSDVIKAGNEILTINGQKIDLIRKRLFNYISSDGAITSYKYRDLSVKFSFYYFMHYGERENFNITYKDELGNIQSTLVDAETMTAMNCKNEYNPPQKLLDFSFRDDNIGILTIKSFDYYSIRNKNENYTDFLEGAFKKLKDSGSEKLIIDLRGNGGGRDTYGSLLYSYLTDQDFSYYKSLHNSSRQLTTADHSNLRLQHPQPNNFQGKVYILTDGYSFSTTAEFCAVTRSNDRATFIGEETGGGYYGNNSGGSVSTTLPHSNITVYVPTIKYVLDVKPNTHHNRGIIPDHHLTPTINDIL
ncbi:S41 family peptidase, partial [Fulvivirga lutimaris]|uniref:S41 family peptidase n=1 Tax=Fulvivirga lutimaris TaxID=1819566 RepID=UPI0012BD2DC8